MINYEFPVRLNKNQIIAIECFIHASPGYSQNLPQHVQRT